MLILVNIDKRTPQEHPKQPSKSHKYQYAEFHSKPFQWWLNPYHNINSPENGHKEDFNAGALPQQEIESIDTGAPCPDRKLVTDF